MAMTNDRRTLILFVASAALVSAACVIYLGTAGWTDDNTRLLLRLTARLAFVVLLLVFLARPLRDLIKTPLTAALLKNRKQFGVTFAGIHSAHMALIIYHTRFVYVVIYLMLITSFSGPARALGPKAWRILHKAGLFLITAVFAQMQLPESLDDLSEVNWGLLGLLVFALLVRGTAFFAKRKKASDK